MMMMMMANQSPFSVLLRYDLINPPYNSVSTIPIVEMGKLKFREVQDPARDHMASGWPNWDLNLGSLSPDPIP